MNAFYENIRSKGWDKYFLSVEKEFETIREELSLSQKTNNNFEIENLNIKSNIKKDIFYLTNTLPAKDITIEFKKLREELNISPLDI